MRKVSAPEPTLDGGGSRGSKGLVWTETTRRRGACHPTRDMRTGSCIAACVVALVAVSCWAPKRRPAQSGAALAEPPRDEARPVASATELPDAGIPFRLPCEETDLVGCTNACTDGVREDCVTLGSMYMRGEIVSVDHDRAIDLFRGACTDGSARGCIRLADVYHAGILS